MAANLDMTNDRANIAFRGSRNSVWHRQGQEMQAGMTIDQWAVAAGLNWTAIKVPAIAALEGDQFDHIAPELRFRPVEGMNHIVRSDNGHPLGYVSDRYQSVQPRELLDWFQQYIGVDDRFQLDVAGSLKKGEIIWGTATYNGDIGIAGESHTARLLMTTTFDGSGATINQGTMTRTVCQNTLNMSLADKRSVIRTRHNTRFDAVKVGKELSAIAQGFVQYKAIGDAMATVHMSADETKALFLKLLDVDGAIEDASTRKRNMLDDLVTAHNVSMREGAERNSAWSALQAITRYVDHDRTTRGGNDAAEATILSTQLGSGAAMKGKAMDLLMPLVKDRVLIGA